MVTFARVVQAGSFAGAARRLGVTHSVASKHVSKLEKSLGARLLHRATRRLSLTEAGAAYFEHCARILEEVENSERAVARLQAQPRGLLRVTAPPSMVAQHIARALPAFREQYPDVVIEIDSSNRLVDLAEEGYDIALRLVREPPPNVIARKLADVGLYLAASPDYVDRHGMPTSPTELADHDCLVFAGLANAQEWSFLRDGERVSVPVRGPFRANTAEPLRFAAIAGMGIVLLPSFQVGSDMQRGRLLRLLPDWRSEADTTLYAIYLPTRYVAPKLRAFVQFLQQRFGPVPYWERGIDPPAAP